MAEVAYLANIFDSLNNLNFIRASFTVIGHVVKLQLSTKTHSMKIFATRYEKAAIGFLKKKFACDKEVGIKKIIIKHLELLPHNFADYYSEAVVGELFIIQLDFRGIRAQFEPPLTFRYYLNWFTLIHGQSDIWPDGKFCCFIL